MTPENVGGSSDVLYSSAGNVREDMYFNYGIFAFGWEVGGSVYNPATGNFQDGTFQPPGSARPTSSAATARRWSTQRHHGDVPDRRDFGKDKAAATSSLDPAGQSDSPKGVRFEVSEPRRSTTRPTALSRRSSGRVTSRRSSASRRDPVVEATTTFKWFSVDAAGNMEAASRDGPDRRERPRRRHSAGDPLA